MRGLDSPIRKRPKFALALMLALGGAGVLIYGFTLASEFLAAPAWCEPAVRGASRFAYFLRLPLIIGMASVVPFEGHHVTKPFWFYLFTSFGAPFFWLGLSLPVLGARRLARKLARRPPKDDSVGRSVTRRAFLTTSVTVPAALAGYSVLLEPQRLRIARYRMLIRDLPASLNGFRLVQVSDTHYGPFISLPYLNAAVDQANALQADLVLLTGDYVHHTPDAIGPGVDVLKRLRGRLGVVATLGNHDHWEGANEVRAAFREIGIPLIDNARRFVTANALIGEPLPGNSLCLGGVGDLWEDKSRFDLATADAPPEMPRIVLAHNPDSAEIVLPGTRVDLMCSGHTHGGQVWVPGFGTPVLPSGYGQKYAGGLCKGPQCPVIVSRGVGMAVLPVRFGVPPELVELTLAKA